MINGLKLLFGAILAVMLCVTISASLERGLFESVQLLLRPPA